MRVAVTGASGLIGSALVASLDAAGHEVLRLVRRPARGPDEVTWDPQGGSVDLAGLDGVDGVVHLAGAGIGDRRWTAAHKRAILDSRVLGTRTLVNALAALGSPPAVLVSGSGMDVYPAGEAECTESSPEDDSFLAGVVKAWEAEARRADSAGIRVVTARTGLVMSRSTGTVSRLPALARVALGRPKPGAPSAGSFGQLLPLIRLGIGGPLGSGRQWWSWITLDDEVEALRFLLTADVEGPVNLTAPAPARQADVVRAVARALHRPAVVPTPAFALRLALGELADVILTGRPVIPRVLLDAGYTFRHPTLAAAADWLAED